MKRETIALLMEYATERVVSPAQVLLDRLTGQDLNELQGALGWLDNQCYLATSRREARNRRDQHPIAVDTEKNEVRVGSRVRVIGVQQTLVVGTVVKVNRQTGYYSVFVDNAELVQDYLRDVLVPYVDPTVTRVMTRRQLLELKDLLRVRDDWHEPDEQEVTVDVKGDTFDNAGFWGEQYDGRTGLCEYYVEVSRDLGNGPEVVAEVNLATLFAWATGYEK